MKASWPPIYIHIFLADWGRRLKSPKSPICEIRKNSQDKIPSYKESSPAWYGTISYQTLQRAFYDQERTPPVLLEKIDC